MKYPSKTLLMIDSGLFVDAAVRLSRDFGRVLYWSNWATQSPVNNQRMIGEVPGIQRVNDFFDYLDETDCIFATDSNFPDLQCYIDEVIKIPLFGAKRGSDLEIYRDSAKKHFRRLNLPVGNYVKIKGMAALREYLKDNDNVYIKVDGVLRGSAETFHSANYKTIEPHLDELTHDLGPIGRMIEFVVESHLDAICETGSDTYSVGGEFPDKWMLGVECKNQSYLAHAVERKNVPKEISEFNDIIGPTLKKYNYAQFISTEIRVVKGKNGEHISYMNDATCRCPSPPFCIMQEMFENLGEIVWEGAHGRLVNPVIKKKYGAQCVIRSDRSPSVWQAVNFERKWQNNVKLYDHAKIGHQHYVVPQFLHCQEVGWCLGLGNSPEEAIEECKEVADSVTGYGLEIETKSLDEAQARIKHLADNGIRI